MILEHDTRSLGRLAHRVTDVQALDAQLVGVVDLQTQGLDQRLRAGLLRALLGDVPRQGQTGIGLRHLQPVLALAAHRGVVRTDDLHAALRSRQGSGKVRRLQIGSHQQRRWTLLLHVVLRYERLDQVGRVRLRRATHRKMRAVTQVTASAHDRQVHAAACALDRNRDHVDVAVARLAAHVDRLLVLHTADRGQLIPELGSLLVAKLRRRIVHALLQLGCHIPARTVQESNGSSDVLRISVRGDQPDTRGAAPPDRVQQARTGTVIKDVVLAAAQAKGLLQQLDGFLDGPGVRVRTEKPGAPVDRAAVVGDAGKRVVAELKIRIRLVVAEQHVVSRRQRLDQVVLEQQGLGLGPRDRGLDRCHPGQHVGGARGHGAAEVRRHPFFQISRLAHVQHHALGIEHAVHARQVWKPSDQGLRVKARRLRFRHGQLLRSQAI